MRAEGDEVGRATRLGGQLRPLAAPHPALRATFSRWEKGPAKLGFSLCYCSENRGARRVEREMCCQNCEFVPYLFSHRRPEEAAELPGSIDAIPLAAPRDRRSGRRTRRGPGRRGREKEFFRFVADNPLISPESDERIQENPSPFSWSGLVWFWFGLKEFGLRPQTASAGGA